MTRLVQGNETITKDNVKMLGEYIAIVTTRRNFAYFPTQKTNHIFAGLCDSVFHTKSSEQTIDQGYEMASEAICFLCQHMGKKLSDMTTVTKYGVPKQVTVFQGCCFTVSRYINEYIVKSFKIDDIDNPNIEKELGVLEIKIDEKETEEEWQEVDEIILKLDLNDTMKDTLDCFMSGKGYSETARILDCAISTIYSRRKIFEKRYTSIL